MAEVRDSRSCVRKKHRYAHNWYWLKMFASAPNEDFVPFNLIRKIREKLNRHSKTLTDYTPSLIDAAIDDPLCYQAAIHRLEMSKMFYLKTKRT